MNEQEAVGLPLYDAAMAAVKDFYDHADEMFTGIDAIEDPQERLKKLVALIHGLEWCERRLKQIRMRGSFELILAELEGRPLPAGLGAEGRFVRSIARKMRMLAALMSEPAT